MNNEDQEKEDRLGSNPTSSGSSSRPSKAAASLSQLEDVSNGNSGPEQPSEMAFNHHGGARPKIRPSAVPVPVADETEDADDDAEETEEEEEDEEEFTADLPKSFYNYCDCSDNESLGVSGAGQSNLSTEVAEALRQSDIFCRHQRRSNRSRPEVQPNQAEERNSPEFLEMDFNPDSGDDSDDSGDSGRGDDEATEPIRVTSSSEDLENRSLNTAPDLPEPERPSLLQFDHIPDCGVTSAPLQSPANPEDANLLMVRSRSLNSPLSHVRETENPQETGNGSRRHHSGDFFSVSGSNIGATSADFYASDPTVNIEACSAHLIMREALFGVREDNGNTPESETFNGAWSDAQHDEDDEDESVSEKTMIWTELEACKRQVNQVGVSACGATAVINVLQGLEFPHTIQEVIRVVPTKYRANEALLAKYLMSRSVAGTSHSDLIESMDVLSKGQIYGRFFHMFPKRKCKLLSWLSDWIKKGVVPIATLNCQRKEVRSGQTLPDAWHHQMIFGVGPNGVYLTNPLGCSSVSSLAEQLSSPSELLVRRGDILMRWRDDENDLDQFDVQDQRWEDYNVIGQVANVIREEYFSSKRSASSSQQQQQPPQQQATVSSSKRPIKHHVQIPAAYKSGISLFVLKSNQSAYDELRTCPELPVSNHTKMS